MTCRWPRPLLGRRLQTNKGTQPMTGTGMSNEGRQRSGTCSGGQTCTKRRTEGLAGRWSAEPPLGGKWSWTVPTPAWTASKILGIDFWSLDDGWLNVLDNTCTPKQAAQLGVACINPVLVSTTDAGHTWAAMTS